ncbi:hypothetical protein EV182_006234 [Spiromyces aspiralis]|uniref:Uncharacterized protein n=1 Tax=Spiromyces aspiralis TaxID=68401 RepID=A0ACC1H9W1_9FUNG|nr:hypothetical protein EV182_006234 [Spiromyces aspiralis]
MVPEKLDLKKNMSTLSTISTKPSLSSGGAGGLPLLSLLDPVGFVKAKLAEWAEPYVDWVRITVGRWLEQPDVGVDRASQKGVIDCMAWHPHKSLLAMVHGETNSILIYDLANDMWFPNVLRHEKMTGIRSLAWQPSGGLTLAAGCNEGVALWRIIQPQPAPWMTLLECDGGAAVRMVGFDPFGRYLAAGSSSLDIWDVALETKVTLRRSGRVDRAGWSPDGAYLYTLSDKGLRVWDTKDWGCQVWKERIRCACWTSDSQGLFFCMEGASDVYMLIIESRIVNVVGTFPSYRSSYDGDEDDIIVGGAIDKMALDPTGSRLVLSFLPGDDATDPSLLAVYFVHSRELMPGGFIRGPDWGNVGPKVRFTNPGLSCMAFASHYEQGCLLGAAWANGKVSFIPMHFNSS